MRQVALTTIKGGLSRQRDKGGALKDSLYDLLNGYVTTEKTIRSRPGTTQDAELPAGTKGLVYFNGEFHVFASDTVANIPAGYALNVVRGPSGAGSLSRIHFAEPFLGNLYVVAEFSSGAIYHYWLKTAEDWQAKTEYDFSDVVVPTTDNGYRYTPRRATQPYPQWSPNVPRTVGDKVEPSQFLGYYFEVISTSGTDPRSGSVEPRWIDDPLIRAGKRYYESSDGAIRPDLPEPPDDPDGSPPVDRDLRGRYGNGRRRPRRYFRDL